MMAFVVLFAQTLWELTALMVGIGFTIILKTNADPTQVLAVGVTLIKAVSETRDVLTAVKDAIFPLPLAPNPIAVMELVHVKVVPLTLLLKVMALLMLLLHNEILLMAVTAGVGANVNCFTVAFCELLKSIKLMNAEPLVSTAMAGYSICPFVNPA